MVRFKDVINVSEGNCLSHLPALRSDHLFGFYPHPLLFMSKI